MNRDAILEVKHLSKSFGANAVLKDIDFVVHPGDVTSIIGSSGSGKSTLLRCINLLETPTSGDVVFHGDSVVDKKVNAAAYRAKVGMVFQSFNLFNNMSVLENCIIGQTKVLKRNKEEAKELWPLIQWCLEFSHRKLNEGGVVASDRDEWEGRFPAGKANLCTSSLYYDALLSSAYLADDLGKKAVAGKYRSQAKELEKSIGIANSAQ